VRDAKRLRALEDVAARLKRLVADHTHTLQVLTHVLG